MNSIDRRFLLRTGLAAAGAAALAACTGRTGAPAGSAPRGLVGPSGSAVTAAEAKRRSTGREHRLALAAAPAVLDLGGGVTPKTWAYTGLTPGREVRVTAGDTVVADLSNQLPGKTTTSAHWHGIALRNDMDGAPGVTQSAVGSGSSFTYRFVTDTPGTYFFHSHVGVQLDRALHVPLIVEDPAEPLGYDDEWVVVLDDWLDGIDGTPDDALAELRQRMGGPGDMHGMRDMQGTDGPGRDGGSSAQRFTLSGTDSPLLGGETGDVNYPYHLINGRIAADPAVRTAKPGTKLRLRIINAGADTAYRVALGGHRMTITHTDGYPVRHREVDALLLGMGERYDVLVTLGDGVFPLVAEAEGKRASGLAVLRTGKGTAPAPGVRPAELGGEIVTASELTAADEVSLKPAEPDVTHRIRLTGSMATYDWAVNGVPYDMDDPLANPVVVEEGQRVRLDFVNASRMWHPMHLHGHTYQLGTSGPRKDTTIVRPGRTVPVYFDARNPGEWMLHCHNLYHGAVGMMAVLAYRT
ncbi:multicopper oxidase family protein [Streptomyces sp. NPDC047000]|uniref:multicopper oxidase family protein n=1 Tax=Streptomyces sp. NPDC047000 TaxID=3155474 RepID=UPI00340F29C6